MARRGFKRRNGHKTKLTIPVALVAGMLPGAWRLWAHRQDFSTITNEAGRIYLGYDSWTGSWDFGTLRFGTLPIAIGYGVHFLAQKLGINRAIARTGLPFIRI